MLRKGTIGSGIINSQRNRVGGCRYTVIRACVDAGVGIILCRM